MGLTAMLLRYLQRTEVLLKAKAGRMTLLSAAHVLDPSSARSVGYWVGSEGSRPPFPVPALTGPAANPANRQQKLGERSLADSAPTRFAAGSCLH